MASTAPMNPYTSWAEMRRSVALRNATACSAAVHDVLGCTVFTFEHVAMHERTTGDVGILRLEFDRLVFAGQVSTRVVPFASIVLLGTEDLFPAPEPTACYVNSSDHPAKMLFWCADPIEYHIGAWYSRWVEHGASQIGVPTGMVSLPPAHR